MALFPMLALAAFVAFTEWKAYCQAAAAMHILDVEDKAFIAAEKISFERGPMNAALGDDLPANPDIEARLAAARTTSDAALTHLSDAMEGAQPAASEEARVILNRTRMALREARVEVDKTLHRPWRERTPDMVRSDIASMVGVVDIFTPITSLLSRDIELVRPQLIGAAVAGRLAMDLREHAGRLGSAFTPILTARQPLTDSDITLIERERGRVEEIAHVLLPRASQYSDDTDLNQAIDTMNKVYFGRGLSYIDSIMTLYRRYGDAGITPAAFAAQYVPDMTPILAVRDALIALMQRDLQDHFDQNRHILIISVLVEIAVLVAFLGLLGTFKRVVIVPLMQATKHIISLAEGQLPPEPTLLVRSDEIGELMQAIETLKRHSVDRQRLESDREELITQLRLSSSTDFLTGLLNRRDFYKAGETLFAQTRHHGASLSLIAADIDHFKAVNDKYGHPAGDLVLVEFAKACRLECRSEDVVCRSGGEEFFILTPMTRLEAAMQIAERLRQRIADTHVTLANGDTIQVTVSFGVAAYRPADAGLDQLIRRADHALYTAKNTGRNCVRPDEPPAA